MKRLSFVPALVFAAGCVAYTTPSGTYIQPLVDVVLVGPPVVVAPPPAVTVRALPPVVVVPERNVYFWGGSYYYYWDSAWYWGRERRGPWHRLPREYWPQRMERHEEHRDDHGRGRGHGHGGP